MVLPFDEEGTFLVSFHLHLALLMLKMLEELTLEDLYCLGYKCHYVAL
jgi:hypothetical protein